MNEERLLELLGNPDLNEILREYYSGETGEFDLDFSYKFTEYPDIVRTSESPVTDISAIALDIANNELPNLRRYEEFAALTDEELITLSALAVARSIQHEEDKHGALVQGDEWRSDASKVTQYGTKSRAENKGYDQYMDSHVSAGYQFLTPILTLLEEQKQEQNQEQPKAK